MAHVLSISDDTTFSLTTGDCSVSHYVPTSPEPSRVRAGDPDSPVVYNFVTETIEVTFQTATTTLTKAAINTVEEKLRGAARRRNQRAGTKVFLNLQVHGESSSYRSEILHGHLELAPISMQAWASTTVEARIHITRMHYWEGPETQLSMTYSGGSGTTGTVNNDSGSDYVQFASTDVDGVVPAPLKLYIKNATGGSYPLTDLWISNNVWSDPVNFTNIFEAESADYEAGVSTVDATCTNGNKSVVTWTGVEDMRVLTWGINDTEVAAAAGRTFHVLMRLAASTSKADLWFRLGSGLLTGSLLLDVVYAPEIANQQSRMVYIGAVPIPTGKFSEGWGGSSHSGIGVRLRANSSGTVNFDNIRLFPGPEFRHIYQSSGLNMLVTDRIVDNAIDDEIYLEDIVSGDVSPQYRAEGSLRVWPNQTQRLYFAFQSSLTAAIDDDLEIQAWYRPRLLTV